MKASNESRKFKVGAWAADPDLDQLSDNGRVKTLEPRVMAILAYMAEKPGELVTPEELISEVWGGTIVSDGPVYQGVTRLRRALEDDPQNPRYIATIPKKGYRLIAPVTLPARKGPIKPAQTGIPFLSPAIVMLIVSGFLFISTSDVATPRLDFPPRAIEFTSIAVLPFTDMSEDQSQEYLGDGIADELIHMLSNMPDTQVIARTSSFSFKNKDTDLPTIGDKLNVDVILQGSVRKSGDRLRITVQLVRADTARQIWSQRFERKAGDILTIQDEIARDVASSLGLDPALSDHDRIAESPTNNSEAYEQYLLGRYHWNKRQPEPLEKALEYFQRAVELDPDFALAYVGLANTYDFLSEYSFGGKLPSEEAWAKGMLAVERALALNDELADTYFALGHLRLDEARNMHQPDKDLVNRREPAEEKQYLDKVEEAWLRGIELNPNSALAHGVGSQMARWRGQLNKNLAHMQAAASLDPLSAVTHMNLGEVYSMVNRLEDAEREINIAIELEPTWHIPLFFMGGVYASAGRFDEAMRWAIRALRAEGPEARLGSGIMRALGDAYLTLGDYETAQKWFDSAGSVHKGQWLGSYSDVDLLMIREQYDEVHRLLTEWLADFPDQAPLFVNGGLYEMMMGHDDHAMPLYEKALSIPQIWDNELAPNNLFAYGYLSEGYLPAVNLAHLYLKAGRDDDAQKLFDQIDDYIETSEAVVPNYVGTMYVRASVMAVRGDKSSALSLLRSVVDSGWHYALPAQRDPNFISLRDGSEFQVIMDQVNVQRAEMLERVKQVAVSEGLQKELELASKSSR